MTWSMFYLEIFMLIHMAHWKSCLTFYQCAEYTITVYYCLSGALRMGCHWLINVRWWSRKMVDQNAFLYSLSLSLSLFGHHYVYQRCVHTCILYTMLSSTIQSFICIIGFACLLNVPLASAAIWQFYQEQKMWKCTLKVVTVRRKLY